MTIVHGGNVYEIAARLGCSPESLLDYSASINPFGPPPGLKEKVVELFGRLEHYPDIRNNRLVESLARFHGISHDGVAVGNGSTELIYWLPKILETKKVAVVLPTFGEYRKAFELQNGTVRKVMCTETNAFQPTVDELERMCREYVPDAVLFTHPASPAGTVLSREVKDWIVEASRSGRMYCIVDEVFVDFCEEESLKGALGGGSSKLVIIRSMTKFYGIPGLRLGYVLASTEVISRMRHFLPPWSVNTFAQMAGAHCLAQEEYRRKTLDLIDTERQRMATALEKTGCIGVFPGRANYLLLRLGEELPAAPAMCADILGRHRILIRDCSSFEGLNDRYVRLAVRLPEQNDRVLTAVREWAGQYAQ